MYGEAARNKKECDVNIHASIVCEKYLIVKA